MLILWSLEFCMSPAAPKLKKKWPSSTVTIWCLPWETGCKMWTTKLSIIALRRCGHKCVEWIHYFHFHFWVLEPLVLSFGEENKFMTVGIMDTYLIKEVHYFLILTLTEPLFKFPSFYSGFHYILALKTLLYLGWLLYFLPFCLFGFIFLRQGLSAQPYIVHNFITKLL